VTNPAAAAQGKAGQSAVEVGKQAWVDVVVQASPAADAEAARYGAAAHAKTEAEAGSPRPAPTQYLENIVENQAGIGAIGDPAEQLADRKAEQRTQISRELAMGGPEAEPEPEASWQQGKAERPSAAAAPEAGASLDAPEIGDHEPELGL
jgi:hypothetical protein